MKKNNIYMVVAAVLVLIACFTVRGINHDSNYDKAVQLLDLGEIESAIEIFDALGNYRNSRNLCNYAKAIFYLEQNTAGAEIIAKCYMERVNEAYEGEKDEEIFALRTELCD
ncbi:MAG: hypothetical protein RR057_03930 [Clostridia bacterium]